MSDVPLRTRVYTAILVFLTAISFAIVWRTGDQTLPSSQWLTAGILLAMILVAEYLDVSFPQAGNSFAVSVAAAFCFAAGLTIGPLLGGAVVVLAYIIDGLFTRRQPIKTAVNAAGLGLSTVISGAVYFGLAEPARSTLGSYPNLLAVVVAAMLYTLVNTGSLALIVSPVMGISPFELWRANFSGLSVEMLTLVTLGSLIPVLVRENPVSIVLLIVPLMIGPRLAFRAIKEAHHETRVTMEGLADALERRDPYTYRHSIRVTEYVRMILDRMPHVPRPTTEAIIAAAHIHDLGKVSSQDASLNKPGALTADERQELENHPVIGAEIVGRLEAYRQSVDTIRHHHERWDGSGYPDGLAGERIPLGARIIAVADAFDAMTSDRVYRAAMPVDAALAELRKGRDSQFDPQIVDLFHDAYEEWQPIPEPATRAEPQAGAYAPDRVIVGNRSLPRLLPRRPHAS